MAWPFLRLGALDERGIKAKVYINRYYTFGFVCFFYESYNVCLSTVQREIMRMRVKDAAKSQKLRNVCAMFGCVCITLHPFLASSCLVYSSFNMMVIEWRKTKKCRILKKKQKTKEHEWAMVNQHNNKSEKGRNNNKWTQRQSLHLVVFTIIFKLEQTRYKWKKTRRTNAHRYSLCWLRFENRNIEFIKTMTLGSYY